MKTSTTVRLRNLPPWSSSSATKSIAQTTPQRRGCTSNGRHGYIYCKAGVGAIATHFDTNPSYRPKALQLLQSGQPADVALENLLRTHDGFEGQGIASRQVGIVDGAGHAATFTGEEAEAAAFAGSERAPGFSIQGKGLTGPEVLQAMREVFMSALGPLANRLMAALEAGQAAGGQSTGRLSAAILVRTSEGGFQDVDLRVDAAADPILNLRLLLSMHDANEALGAADYAERHGDSSTARLRLADSVRLAADWDRVWRRVARLDMALDEHANALAALASFASLNPMWAHLEIDDPIYAPYGAIASQMTGERDL